MGHKLWLTWPMWHGKQSDPRSKWFEFRLDNLFQNYDFTAWYSRFHKTILSKIKVVSSLGAGLLSICFSVFHPIEWCLISFNSFFIFFFNFTNDFWIFTTHTMIINESVAMEKDWRKDYFDQLNQKLKQHLGSHSGLISGNSDSNTILKSFQFLCLFSSTSYEKSP